MPITFNGLQTSILTGGDSTSIGVVILPSNFENHKIRES